MWLMVLVTLKLFSENITQECVKELFFRSHFMWLTSDKNKTLPYNRSGGVGVLCVNLLTFMEHNVKCYYSK